MNQEYAIQILSTIREGINGHHDIYQAIKQNSAFFDMKATDFAATIAELKDIECIVMHPNGRPKFYDINPNKDCLHHLHAKLAASRSGNNVDDEIKRLTKENLILQNKAMRNKWRDISIGAGVGAIVTWVIENAQLIVGWFR